jgi:RNA polymerase sigma factor (sigma-70 family)
MLQSAKFDQLMAEVATGSDEAVWQLAETYTPYILRAVRHNLSPRLRQKLDSQDFAQTLWASLLLRPTELTRLKNPEQLIAYLVRATKNKVCEKARRYTTQKCDMRRETSLDHDPGPGGKTFRDRALYSKEPSPSIAASVRERWHQILSDASERDREIIRMRREGDTFETISRKLHIDERTARRAMHRLLQQFTE